MYIVAGFLSMVKKIYIHVSTVPQVSYDTVHLVQDKLSVYLVDFFHSDMKYLGLVLFLTVHYL